jgi:hypothetical protein
VKALAARGVVVSAGHSMATFAQAKAGFAAGARYGTHIFNAMPTLEHRAPGLPGALLTTPGQVVGLIPDGVHTHPAIVALVWQMKGAAGLTLVTDAMAALGMPPGKYMLGDQEVTVTDDQGDARLPSGTLAGSVLAMDEALRWLLRFTGCSLHDALPTITARRLRVLGLTRSRGRLAPAPSPIWCFWTPTWKSCARSAAGIDVVFELGEKPDCFSVTRVHGSLGVVMGNTSTRLTPIDARPKNPSEPSPKPSTSTDTNHILRRKPYGAGTIRISIGKSTNSLPSCSALLRDER